jgi:hypothetical protein
MTIFMVEWLPMMLLIESLPQTKNRRNRRATLLGGDPGHGAAPFAGL